MKLNLTKELPPQVFGVEPEWVAIRFDIPDLRGPTTPMGLSRIASFPGDWRWCKVTDLVSYVINPQKEVAVEKSDNLLSPENLAKLQASIEKSEQLYTLLKEIKQ